MFKAHVPIVLSPELVVLVDAVLAAPVPSELLEVLLESCNEAMKSLDCQHAHEFWARLNVRGVDDIELAKRVHHHVSFTLLNKYDAVRFPRRTQGSRISPTDEFRRGIRHGDSPCAKYFRRKDELTGFTMSEVTTLSSDPERKALWHAFLATVEPLGRLHDALIGDVENVALAEEASVALDAFIAAAHEAGLGKKRP